VKEKIKNGKRKKRLSLASIGINSKRNGDFGQMAKKNGYTNNQTTEIVCYLYGPKRKENLIMARLASQEKMGYYPTPINVVEDLKKIINIQPKARLLDTCCGEGQALSIIAKGTETETFGVELDRQRSKKAQEVLQQIVWGDALYEFRASKKAFGLLWLNPPYDNVEVDLEQKIERLEKQFLSKHWDYLQDRGVLVYIIPFDVLKKVASFFYRRCTNLNVLSFPWSDYQKFKQIVLLCAKPKSGQRPGHDEVKKNIELLESVCRNEFSEVPENLDNTDEAVEAGIRYHVPAAAEIDNFYFWSRRFNPDQAIKQVKMSAVRNRVVKIVLPVTTTNKVQTLAPLREGHIAMLLASGMMNGEIIGDDNKKLIVKGSAKKIKQKTTEENDSTEKYIEIDRYQIGLKVA